MRAVAVAAPAADLGRLLTDEQIGDDPGVTISAYAFATYQTAYAAGYPGLSLESILTPQGAALTPQMARCACSASTKSCHAAAATLVGNYVTSDPATTPPWSAMLAENTPGGSVLDVPV